MPSTRSANFADDYVDGELIPTGLTTRDLPPASRELRAPSDVADRADARHRREHPAKVGRPRNDDAESTIGAVFEALREGLSPRETAEEIESTPRRAKELMTTAKQRMARRIDDYVDAHLVATKVAAVSGDAKPAQWALENIAVEGERVVDPPAKNLPPAAPTFNLGFVIGGMPQTPRQLPPAKA